MAEQRLRLEVVTPRRRLLSADVAEVRIPGVLGEMGILPGHTPLLTSLGTGPLTYFEGPSPELLAVQGGFAEVLPDRVTVIARVAETRAEIDVDAARREVTEAEEAMKNATADELDDLRRRAQLGIARLDVAGG